MLDNLLENALAVSPRGSHDHGRGAVVAVVDRAANQGRGPGLAREERERAFDRFWRNRSGEGSGLGLAIVRRLVEQDGGKVELLDAPGHGLEAVVRLRRA